MEQNRQDHLTAIIDAITEASQPAPIPARIPATAADDPTPRPSESTLKEIGEIITRLADDKTPLRHPATGRQAAATLAAIATIVGTTALAIIGAATLIHQIIWGTPY